MILNAMAFLFQTRAEVLGTLLVPPRNLETYK
jgi:hypothetical protein